MITQYNVVLYLTILKAVLALDNKGLGALIGYSEVQTQRIMSMSNKPTERVVVATQTAITNMLGPYAIYDMNRLITGAFADEYK